MINHFTIKCSLLNDEMIYQFRLLTVDFLSDSDVIKHINWLNNKKKSVANQKMKVADQYIPR